MKKILVLLLLTVCVSCSSHKNLMMRSSKMELSQAFQPMPHIGQHHQSSAIAPQQEHTTHLLSKDTLLSPAKIFVPHRGLSRKSPAFTAPECDEIILRNGGTISAKITEIGTDEIKYKKCTNPDGPVYSIEKSQVKEVQYANGTTDTFEENRVQQHPQVQQARNIEGFSLVSFLLGLLCIILSLLPFSIATLVITILVGLLAVIFGIVGIIQVAHDVTALMGRGFAITGLILGILFIIICIGLLALL